MIGLKVISLSDDSKIDQTCDYYFCRIKGGWHRSNSKIGINHLKYFDEFETNKKDATYYYDGYNKFWHRDVRDFIKFQAKISVSKGEITKTYPR